MITIELNTAIQNLTNCFHIVSSKKDEPIALLSTELTINDFYNITNYGNDDLSIDFTGKTSQGNYLNASISVQLKSKLFIDFKDKSLYRQNYDLNINHIRQMIIPLKYKHNVKTFYIDNFDKVKCDVSEKGEIKHEFKMAQLYYMSHKFEIDFVIGKELENGILNAKKVSDIKFLNFGNSYDMIDKIVLL